MLLLCTWEGGDQEGSGVQLLPEVARSDDEMEGHTVTFGGVIRNAKRLPTSLLYFLPSLTGTVTLYAIVTLSNPCNRAIFANFMGNGAFASPKKKVHQCGFISLSLQVMSHTF
jgi:hypothetical protein